MSIGQGSIGFQNMSVPVPAPGPPFVATSANNGLSVDTVTGKIVLGQNVGAAGDPAQLFSAREIPLKGFNFTLGEAGSQHLFLNPTVRVYGFGDLSGGIGNGSQIGIDDGNQAFDYQTITSGHLLFVNGLQKIAGLGDTDFNGTGFQYSLDYGNQNFRVLTGAFPGSKLFNIDKIAGLYELGDIDKIANGSVVKIDDTNPTVEASAGGAGADRGSMFVTSGGGYASGEFSGLDGAGNSYDFFIDTSNEAFISLSGVKYLQVKSATGTYRIGDPADTGIHIDNGTGEFRLKNAANTSKIVMNGVNGFTGTVTPVTSITVTGGIVTAVI